MTTFRSILVPLDGSSLSQKSLPYVQALRQEGTQVTLLQVVPKRRADEPLVEENEFGWAEGVEVIYASKARAILERLGQEWKHQGILQAEAEVVVIIGDPAETILDDVYGLDPDLIIMTTRGEGALKRALFGSVTDRVVHNSQVPVLVILPEEDVALGKPAAIHRIVLPMDGSLLAETALPLAKDLVQQLSIPIVLVRAVPLSYVVDLMGAIPQETFDGMIRYAYDYHSAIRDHLVPTGIEVSIIVKLGLPFDVIDLVADPEDLIVLTSHGRTGFTRWLLGSVAEKVIHAGASPVLLVPVKHMAKDDQH